MPAQHRTSPVSHEWSPPLSGAVEKPKSALRSRRRVPAPERTVRDLLALADVVIDGPRPWDIQVHDERLFARVLTGASLALGEAYMDGWWDCAALDQFFDRVLRARLDCRVVDRKRALWAALVASAVNLQNKSRAYEVGRRHYDIGNDLYRRMLDRRMIYSCGYWEGASTLDGAQEKKLELIFRKIGLEPGQKVLDIGCGWGGAAAFAAEKFGARVVGVTVSKEQAKLAGDACRGLPVEIRLQDYRDLDERFDHIFSVGMFEHVGCRNYRAYMGVVDRCLAPGGLFLLHTIGGNRSVKATDPWIGKYIFPNSMLPSAEQIVASAEGLFAVRDWHSFGFHYDKTLMAWHQNFVENWDEIASAYDPRFYRMWTYYLLSCAGSFRADTNQVWQVVFSREGERGDYRSAR